MNELLIRNNHAIPEPNFLFLMNISDEIVARKNNFITKKRIKLHETLGSGQQLVDDLSSAYIEADHYALS